MLRRAFWLIMELLSPSRASSWLKRQYNAVILPPIRGHVWLLVHLLLLSVQAAK